MRADEAHPNLEWRFGDLAHLTTPDQWNHLLQDIDVVINASGVLQDGWGDKVEQVQASAISALAAACADLPVKRIIQISAPGAMQTSSTAFYRTKAQADGRVAECATPSTILRPGLVVGAQSYGGGRLLRMLAAFPMVQPVAYPETRIQTVALDEVAAATLIAAEEAIDGDFDLVENHPHTLSAIIEQFRHWLGVPASIVTIRTPNLLTSAVTFLADVLGWLGWRSPLRRDAMAVLRDGVVGDSAPWNSASGQRLSSLQQTLERMPATFQERMAARATLVFPALIAILAVFWIASGFIGAWQYDRAAAVLPDSLSPAVKSLAVYGGACADVLIGLMMVFRPALKIALIGSLIVSASYLIGGAILAPALWSDPLGPMVKIFPAMGLSLAALALFGNR